MFRIAVATLGIACTIVSACIRDRDTIEMERAQFPEVREVLAGSGVLGIQTVSNRGGRPLPLPQLEKTFRLECAAGARAVAAIRDDEQRWIAEGADVDARFREKYHARAPRLIEPTAAGEEGAARE